MAASRRLPTRYFVLHECGHVVGYPLLAGDDPRAARQAHEARASGEPCGLCVRAANAAPRPDVRPEPWYAGCYPER
jgi:hypothetical protein